MSFLKKLKSVNTAPPTPRRRTDDSEDGWPQDEFDDDDEEDNDNGDMYETPPCEQAVKVPQRQEKESVYLDKQSSPAVPQTQPIPPRRDYKLPTTQQCGPFFFETNTRKPPEIDRKVKPGRKALMFSPTAASHPASTEEDVYLNPQGEQNEAGGETAQSICRFPTGLPFYIIDNSDDLYLEPLEACSLSSPEPMRIPFPPKTSVKSSPISITKPPVPRAKPNPLQPSLAELEKVSSKLPSPIPRVRTSLPVKLKEASPSSSNPQMADTGFVASLRERYGNEDNEWFAGDLNRKSAEILLLKINKDGAFLVRQSSAKSGRQPFTLAVLHQQKVYNIPIRFLDDTQGYALGKEGKTSEEVFSSLEEMISHHQKNQLLLIDSKSQAKQTAYLSHPVRP